MPYNGKQNVLSKSLNKKNSLKVLDVTRMRVECFIFFLLFIYFFIYFIHLSIHLYNFKLYSFLNYF